MTQRPHDPRCLDVAAFAAEGAALEGNWPLAELPRLLESVDPPTEAQRAAGVAWQAGGECTAPQAGLPRVWLHLAVSTEVTMTCQRCLGPLAVALDVDRRFGFVEGEAQAAALDAELDDDVLTLERGFDLRALVEDELLLALPLVPRHADCSPPAGAHADDAPPGQTAADHPFAALAVLRQKKAH